MKDPLCVTAYEQHQKYLRDKHAREQFLRQEGEARGYAKGEAFGRAEGKAEALKAFVKSFLDSGMSVEEIAFRLNKDVSEIRQLLR